MSDFPGGFTGTPVVISPFHLESLGINGSWHSAFSIAAGASSTWPVANTAIYIPFYTPVEITVVKIAWFNGATASGNLDVGIYDAVGSRLVSSGSTAQSGTSTDQAADIADTTLPQGRYYMAMSMNGTTATINRVQPTIMGAQAMGIRGQTSAFALPSPATFGAPANNFLPLMWLTTRTVI